MHFSLPCFSSYYGVVLHTSDCRFCVNVAVLCPLYYYRQKHPVNYLLLGIFTISLAFAVGLTCAFTNGKIEIQERTAFNFSV